MPLPDQRAPVRKLYVDPATGVHGFLISESRLYYHNFFSKKVHEVRLGDCPVGRISAIELFQDDGSGEVFQLLIGSE